MKTVLAVLFSFYLFSQNIHAQTSFSEIQKLCDENQNILTLIDQPASYSEFDVATQMHEDNPNVFIVKHGGETLFTLNQSFTRQAYNERVFGPKFFAGYNSNNADTGIFVMLVRTFSIGNCYGKDSLTLLKGKKEYRLKMPDYFVQKVISIDGKIIIRQRKLGCRNGQKIQEVYTTVRFNGELAIISEVKGFIDPLTNKEIE